MRIKHTTLHVDDQAKALRFYTEILGFMKKADFSLTVVSPQDPEGTELQLELARDPAAKAFQRSRLEQGTPALNLVTDNMTGDCDRIRALGGDFAMPPTDATASKIARLYDTVGNLIQLTELTR